MDIILIPGFWLDASSWNEVAPVLEQAGHRVRPLTLPGLESRDAHRSGIRLRDHVEAVVAAVDEADGPVVLVGHSGGGAIAYAAADARPDRVARVVYVDSGPLADGGAINDELPVVDRSEEHTSELQSRPHLVCRLLLEKKKNSILPLTPGKYHNTT